MKKVKLKNSHIELFIPDIEYFVDKINSNDIFSFAKLNHAFWDMVSKDGGNQYLIKFILIKIF
jgi:hypothetical protein